MPRRKKSPILQKLTGPAAARYGALPKIPLPADNELQRSFNADVAHVLRAAGADLYRRATVPMRPFDGRLMEMKPAPFVSWSQKYFVGYKTKTDRDGQPYQVLRDMTESVAKLTLEDHDFIGQLPQIHRVYPSPVPVITEQGALILCTPGYDPSTGTYVFEGNITPKDPDPAHPPIQGPVSSDGYFDDSLTIGDAFWRLYDLYADFPFSDWSDPITPADSDPLYRENPDGTVRTYRLSRSLSVQVGSMLALFAANCIPREASRMGFIMDANSQRSGKTLLVKITTAPVYGTFKAQGWRDDDESLAKILDSEILAASPYICFDNVRSFIQSDKLESLFTSPLWTGRILGKTENFTAENNTVVFITGNNVNAGTDILHRCLRINLYVEESDVQSRQRPDNIISDVWLAKPENRRHILSALWAIVRHWDQAGRPLSDIHKTRLGFEEWGQIIGGMVDFAMFGDMLEHPPSGGAGDTELEDVLSLVKILHRINHTDYTTQEIVHHCWENGLLPWILTGREEMRRLRHDSSEPAVDTFVLDGKGNSKIGFFTTRHAAKLGSIHTFRDDSGNLVRVRFHSKGAGRHKRFLITKI